MDPASHHFEDLGGGVVRCHVCPHECTIRPEKRGACHTRYNDAGTLRVITHGRLSAAAVDPIEKKPLNHFLPGTRTFSIASAGCNLVCPFCQNHSLSQCLREGVESGSGVRRWTPGQVVDAALENACPTISFTYSEPILSLEMAKEVHALAEGAGLGIVFVTNGQATRRVAQDLTSILAAANVDLKCFDPGAYAKVLGGKLDATLQTMEVLHGAGVWMEVTTLLIPGFNDDDEQLKSIAGFLAASSPDIPWHVSRFHPDYRWMDRPPTSIGALSRALEIGRAEGLHHVYTGNVPGDLGEKTRCARCGTVVVDRVGYRIGTIETVEGTCRKCGEPLAGVGFP